MSAQITDIWCLANFPRSVLAAAHAELGEFEEACHWQSKAITAAPDDKKQQHRDRLKMYENHQPYRIE